MAKRSKSSRQWLHEHVNDPYVKRAHKEGARSRATYKLEELDSQERLLKPGMVVVDLGAAPGGWSQYAAKVLNGKGSVYALDILPMAAIPGVEFIEGDFREPGPLAALQAALGGRPVDLVLSDMAPNMSGIDAVDQPRSMHLVELALEFAQKTLKPGGAFVAKVFQGAGFEELVRATRRDFGEVKLRKPPASRSRSAEMYLVATGRRIV
ncbi:MAG: 23S rRNA (uridine(2552)-2'-O)-methyltransferase RlmE [Steroidobacteraceae bacterium]|jgi:23S rRNA (uridine2552-2'-O)-methyltransferase|nr:23S rRNA (uridine(2552)-2'-O)-methyltransferase RlmE [Steroidobacteraceae bacterium]